MPDQVVVRRPPGQHWEIPLGELPADAGFHALEVEGTRRWRWPDGGAGLALPSGCTDGRKAVLDLHVAAAQPTWLHHDPPATTAGKVGKAAWRPDRGCHCGWVDGGYGASPSRAITGPSRANVGLYRVWALIKSVDEVSRSARRV
jgi:hypothetical protein